MRKINTIIKSAFIPLFCSAVIIGCTQPEKNVRLKENFENLTTTPNFAKNTSIVSEKGKVIDGKKSLLANSLEAKNNIDVLKFEFDKDNIIEISFDYKILESVPNNRIGISVGYMENGKYIPTGYASTTSKFEQFRGLFKVPYGKKMLLNVSIAKKMLVSFDNIKIKGMQSDATSDWTVAKESGLKTLRHTPFDSQYAKFDDIYLNMSTKEFFPCIDKYGQFKHRKWKNKIESENDFAKRINEEEKFFKNNPPFSNRDKYFGLINPNLKFKATGKFRTQKVDDKWFLITPEGNLFWSMGANCVGDRGDSTPLTTREHFFEDVSDKKYISETSPMKFSYSKEGKIKNFTFFKRNIAYKYGKDFDYNQILKKRAASWGMNTYAAWSSNESLDKGVPFTVYLSTSPHSFEKIDGKFKLHGWWMTPPDFFSPKFEKNAKASANSQKDLIKSPLCIGAFFDNELPWQKEPTLLAKGVLSCNANQPAKIEFNKILKKKYNKIEALNKAWNSSFANWEDLLSNQDFFPKTKEGIDDMTSFEKRFCERYFEVCRNAIKEIDKDALYLGCRFGGTTGKLVAPISSHFCDVITINVYRDGVATLTGGEGAQDKPILIGEFHFGDLSNGVFGGGLCPTPNEKEQLKSFKNFTESALSNPAIIGVHWFKYSDQPTTGRFDGENFSVGLVDIVDTPHYGLVSQMRKISKDMYDMRLKSPLNKVIKSEGVDKNYHN